MIVYNTVFGIRVEGYKYYRMKAESKLLFQFTISPRIWGSLVTHFLQVIMLLSFPIIAPSLLCKEH